MLTPTQLVYCPPPRELFSMGPPPGRHKGARLTPVYFVSRALQGPKLNYTSMERLVLALVFAAKRLRRYFQAHPIAVITDQPIKQIISRPDVAGRLQKWSVILEEHNITYRPRTSMKGQILADFLIGKPNEAPQDTSMVEIPQESLTLFTDGSSYFTASNNEAEYEALIAGLWIAAQMRVRNVHMSVDSKLVVNQILGTYVTKEENMVKYLEKTKSLISDFAKFSISQVLRSKNKKANALSKIASTSFAHLSKQVLVEVLKEKSIQEEEVATVVEEEGPTWMTPIMEYLKDETLPDNRKEASKLRIKARQYELLEGPFYKWGIDIAGPFPEGPGKVKFLIVAMDYFTKWIEAKAVATITDIQGKKFGTDNQEKDEKQSQNDKTGLGMEKTVKDKAKSKPESQSSQKVNRKVNWSKSKSTQVNPEVKVKEI
ncbi:reverse transcriptase domain-containing protein [Tanacetum coccineum]